MNGMNESKKKALDWFARNENNYKDIKEGAVDDEGRKITFSKEIWRIGVEIVCIFYL